MLHLNILCSIDDEKTAKFGMKFCSEIQQGIGVCGFKVKHIVVTV